MLKLSIVTIGCESEVKTFYMISNRLEGNMEDKYSYILKLAERDNNIRAVILYGSRVNDDVEPDEYQDYDIFFIVTNVDYFNVSIFDNIKLRFVPSENYPELFPDEYVCLMLFEDDSRIDLSVCTLKTFLTNHYDGLLMKCLLDKDNIIKESSENNRCTYWVKPIDEMSFLGTCSEFLWELQIWQKG